MERRIYSILLSTHVMSFARIKEVVNSDGKVADEQILTCLEQCAVLVQGNWVIKSQQHYRDQLGAIRELLICTRQLLGMGFPTPRHNFVHPCSLSTSQPR